MYSNIEVLLLCMCVYNTFFFYGSGFTTLIRFNYWILCETVLPGQGSVPRLAEVDFTDTDTYLSIKYCPD